METLAVELGVPHERMITETSSQNTMQNAAELRKLLAAGVNRRVGHDPIGARL
ncbi:MAG TPA: ElyC/SanA/YdcF family protein [Sedimentisphaerales bacterium]|nr:ElyC/SanA/YdcF family protein [Sedimentisphaerales bacterium]